MRKHKPWKEHATQAYEKAKSAKRDYEHVVIELEDWARWCRENIGPTGYVSMMGRIIELGPAAYAAMRGAARGPEQENRQAERVGMAVQSLPEPEKRAIQLKYLGVLQRGPKIDRKFNVSDTDCARIMSMSRQQWYDLLGRAYAYIDGYLNALLSDT